MDFAEGQVIFTSPAHVDRFYFWKTIIIYLHLEVNFRPGKLNLKLLIQTNKLMLTSRD